jgi:hypothetical protein
MGGMNAIEGVAAVIVAVPVCWAALQACRAIPERRKRKRADAAVADGWKQVSQNLIWLHEQTRSQR